MDPSSIDSKSLRYKVLATKVSRCLARPAHDPSLHSGPGQAPMLSSWFPQVSRPKCVLQSAENDSKCKIRKRLGNASGSNDLVLL